MFQLCYNQPPCWFTLCEMTFDGTKLNTVWQPWRSHLILNKRFNLLWIYAENTMLIMMIYFILSHNQIKSDIKWAILLKYIVRIIIIITMMKWTKNLLQASKRRKENERAKRNRAQKRLYSGQQLNLSLLRISVLLSNRFHYKLKNEKRRWNVKTIDPSKSRTHFRLKIHFSKLVFQLELKILKNIAGTQTKFICVSDFCKRHFFSLMQIFSKICLAYIQ